jgi:radial spoke head protein 4A
LGEDSKREIVEVTAEDDQELVPPTTNEMNNLEMWQHYKDGILDCCRTTHLEPTDLPEDVEPEEAMKKVEAADPFDEKLKPITEDKQVVVSKNQKIHPWVVRLMGDATEYKTETGKTVSNGVVVLRSLQWPGSYNFYY